MDTIITSIDNPDWSIECYYIRETDTKYFVWTNIRKTIEMHFPKHLYTMNKIEDQTYNKEGGEHGKV